MRIAQYQYIYFIGIGGVGMSSLAQYFLEQNKTVMGYDKTPSPITQHLQKQNINIFFDNENRDYSMLSKDNTLVIYTPAIKDEQADMTFFRTHGYTMFKRAKVLGLITENTYTLAVAGTHGKTTVTSILAHLLKTADVKMTAFIGGFAKNYGSNYISNGNRVSVVEADEFDRSFLELSPDVACITSMDTDHLDIYQDTEHFEDAFRQFANKIQNPNYLFTPKGLGISGTSFGIDDGSHYQIINLKLKNNEFKFDIQTPEKIIEHIIFRGHGLHNLMNALAAFSMASQIEGISEDLLISGLATFEGVERRYDYIINREDFVYIDDYAHHPNEILAVYKATRYAYPDKKIMAIFQPHLYSRTQDFADDFADSLSLFDQVTLLDIYPARELPIEGIDSKWLLSKIKNTNKCLIQKDNIINTIKKNKPEILLTLGAGDIGQEVAQINHNFKA